MSSLKVNKYKRLEPINEEGESSEEQFFVSMPDKEDCVNVDDAIVNGSCDEEKTCCFGRSVTGIADSSVPLPVNCAMYCGLKECDVVSTTKLRVQNMCCGQEAKMLKSSLGVLKGVVSVHVNVPGRVAVVRHKTCVLSKSKIVKILNDKHLGVSIIEQGRLTAGDSMQVSWKFLLQLSTLSVISALYAVTLGASFYNQNWSSWVALALIAIGCFPISLKVISNLRKRVLFDVNLLVLIAIVGIALLGEFLEGATVVFVFQVAGLLQEFCLHKVQKILSEFAVSAPDKAVIAGTKEIVDIGMVGVGTILLVRGGDSVPLDGIVVNGNGSVDEGSITGESMPVLKNVGDDVYSGTILQNGFLEVKTLSTHEDSTLTQISNMLLQAQEQATNAELVIDKFAKVYTPLVLLTALLIFIIPLMLASFHALNYNSQLLRLWVKRSLTTLLVACPCALLMSVPMPMFCSINTAARNGVLVKSAVHMEDLARATTVAFDKTGTLTEGRFQVACVKVLTKQFTEHELLRFAAALESKCHHPIASALVSYHIGCLHEFHDAMLPDVTNLQHVEGLGIVGCVERHNVAVGNLALMDSLNISTFDAVTMCRQLAITGHTIVVVAVDLKVSIVIGLADQPRASAAIAVQALDSLDMKLVMLTGDNEGAAYGIAEAVGIKRVCYGMKPKDKLEWIKTEQTSAGEKIVMIGDGVNDVPSLAAADVGIAVSSAATCMVLNSAHVVLMNENIANIASLLSLSRHARGVCIQNIILAVLFKFVVLFGIMLSFMSVWMVILADLCSLVLVVVNGLRPLFWKGAHGSWQ
eukprot:gene12802-14115_t